MNCGIAKRFLKRVLTQYFVVMAASSRSGGSGAAKKIDPAALAGVFQDLAEDDPSGDACWGAESLRSRGYEIRPEDFAGKRPAVRAGITTLCESWTKKGWLETKSHAGRTLWTPTDDGLVEFRKMLPEWLTDAQELIDSFGETLMKEEDWVSLLRAAVKSKVQETCFKKVYLPWLRHDNFWLLKPDDPEGRSVNRRGTLVRKTPCEGFDQPQSGGA